MLVIVSTSFGLDFDTQYVEEDWEDESEMTSRKRGREMSPSSIRHCISEKKTRRHQKRRDELSRRFKQQAEAKWKAMMEDMMADFEKEASSIPSIYHLFILCDLYADFSNLLRRKCLW